MKKLNFDLRTHVTDKDSSWRDTSQWMLNVMMKDTLSNTIETVIVLCGSGDEVFYDDNGLKRNVLHYNMGVVVPKCKYHAMYIIPPPVIFEVKDRA